MKYVLGFCFDLQLGRVVLIRKSHPTWQYGRLNGIGGKIERGETPEQAMIREFKEETGVHLSLGRWRKFCVISDSEWKVHCFATLTTILDHCKTQTDEEVIIVDVNALSNYKIISNLRWLIPLAIDSPQYKIKQS